MSMVDEKQGVSGSMSGIDITAVENTVGDTQRRPVFRRKRGGVELTRQQVKAIKRGRKLLRRDMKKRGLKRKEDFELMASGMGLYFDKGRGLLLLWWLFHGRGLWALAGAAAALMSLLFLYSTITQLKGHFTINMSDGLFREGFVLSETADFKNPTTHLFCEPAEDIPCISIRHLPKDLDDHEGQHNENYFAYTFFLRNEGASTVDYIWSLDLNSESKNLSSAAWVMVFEDGEMLFYAAPDANGGAEALPAYGDNTRGYIDLPLMDQCREPERQYQVVAQRGGRSYYRAIPILFEDEDTVVQGTRHGVAPTDVHKYTVVIWLEGDDPDCTDELIGGHVGMEISMRLASEPETSEGFNAWEGHWDAFWDNLKFWNAEKV